MTNLTEKLATVEQRMTNNHSDSMSALNGISTQLSDILEALQAPSNGNATLDDVVTELRSVNNTLLVISQDILAMRTAITPSSEIQPSGARTSIHWLIHRIMFAINANTPTSTAGSIATLLQSLLGSIPPKIDVTNTALSSIYSSIGIATTGSEGNIIARLAALADFSERSLMAVGPLQGQDKTVRQLLEQLAANDCGCGGNGVPPSDGDCADPMSSYEMVFVKEGVYGASYDQTIVTWSPFGVTGIIYDYIPGLPQNGYHVIRPAPGYSFYGYRLYVQSDQSTYSRVFNGEQKYLTNTWYTLTDDNPISVVVYGASGVTAYLCMTEAPPIGGDCITGNSSLVTLPLGEDAKQVAVWTSEGATSELPDKPGNFASESIYKRGNYKNWLVTTNEPGMDLYWYDTRNAWHKTSIGPDGVVIEEDTNYIAVYNNGDDRPFTAQVCPLEP